MKNSIIRMSLVIAVVALSVAVFSTPASAQFYFGGKGTAFLPNNSEDGLKDFDTGFGGEAFAGYRFMPFFGLETGVGYYQSKWSDSDNFEGIEIDHETHDLRGPAYAHGERIPAAGGQGPIICRCGYR